MTNPASSALRDVCVLNNCERPQGTGTWVTIKPKRDADMDDNCSLLPVCEDHWLALREVSREHLPAARADRASGLMSRSACNYKRPRP